jgi:uncharacterized protein (DUF362 family)
MKRRDFLIVGAAGGLALRAGGLRLDAAPRIAAPPPPDLGWATGESPGALARAAVDALGGMKAFVGRGDKVVIKPNIGWDRVPEMAATTNPEIVATLIAMVQDAGAKSVIVIDNTTNQAKRCYIRSGIQDAVDKAGGTMLFVDEHRIKKTAIQGEWLKEWDVLLDILEADKVINVPIVKHHSLSRVTLGMKNLLGAVGGARNQLHQKLDQAMVDLAAFIKPTLTVLDAYRILVRNGPQGGRPTDTKLVKTVIAGRDPVAVDTAGASFLDLKAADLLFLRLAADRGLGKNDLAGLTIEKRAV